MDHRLPIFFQAGFMQGLANYPANFFYAAGC
jgi:hypothetical protein